VVSVYYMFRVPDPAAIPVVTEPFEGLEGGHDQERFRWIPLHGASEEHMTLPIDRVVLRMLLDRLR